MLRVGDGRQPLLLPALLYEGNQGSATIATEICHEPLDVIRLYDLVKIIWRAGEEVAHGDLEGACDDLDRRDRWVGLLPAAQGADVGGADRHTVWLVIDGL